MKKILSFIITITLLFTSVSFVFAKSNNAGKNCTQQQVQNMLKARKQVFKINGSPVIKYGRYKLPISPVTKGMGATVTFDKKTAVLTVVKGTTTIVIDFNDKIVTVNGVVKTDSGIFTAKNDKKMVVLIKYIANILGIRTNVDKDKVTVEVPGLNAPTNVAVTPVGTTVKSNTLNSTITYLTATAKITAGQATGGKAELYVGSKLVATDANIISTDTAVTFSTSDGTPTNAELQAIVPAGGVVTVKLYNTDGIFVTSATKNPTLIVDYVIPTLTGITSALYNAAGSYLSINVSGASTIGDAVDVTKISLYDVSLGRTYVLTCASGTGSKGVVSNASTLLINIGSYDKAGLTGFEGADVYMNITAGSLLNDAAGNVLTISTTIQNIPVAINNVEVPGLNAPANVTVTTPGLTIIANTLNSTTLFMAATANITAGQATNGRAELYVGSKLVSVDPVIGATDTTVNFTTSDGTPTYAELQAAIPVGGVVTVKLYNAAGNFVVSTVGNPTLTVDYIAPIITGITSVIYNAAGNYLYINFSGASAINDAVDVTKISLNDVSLARTYVLTNNPATGSKGAVISPNSLIINIGSTDKAGLTGFEGADVFLNVAAGSLLTDAAGNASTPFTTIQTVPVSVIQQ